jgi:hypothetical protein
LNEFPEPYGSVRIDAVRLLFLNEHGNKDPHKSATPPAKPFRVRELIESRLDGDLNSALTSCSNATWMWIFCSSLSQA